MDGDQSGEVIGKEAVLILCSKGGVTSLILFSLCQPSDFATE